MGLKHNCTKEGDFKFVKIDMTGKENDRIKCNHCGRVWEDIK